MYVAIVRFYENIEDASQTLRELERFGIPSSDTSLIANNSDERFDETAGPVSIPIAAGDVEEKAATAGAGVEQGRADRDERRPTETQTRPTREATTPARPAGEAGTGASPVREEDDVKLDPAVGAGIGALAGAASGMLLTGLALLFIPGIGPAVGAGWLVAALAGGGAVGGAAMGGLVGALTALNVSPSVAELYAEGVRRGGAVVATRVPEQDASQIEKIMDRGAVDIRQREAEYRRSGWRSFDPDAAPYTADQVRNERELHKAA